MIEEISTPAVQQIPPSVVQAICAIKLSMEAVRKTGKNPHGGYMFASADDIYAALSRKMGEVGLTCMCLEEHPPEITRVEKDGKTVQWAKFTFVFVLATKDATWSDPRCRRTLFIQVTGPQTFQSAQSYCEKAFYRSLFTIPTGDLDLDSIAQADTEEDQAALNVKNGKKRKSSYAAKKDGTDAMFNEIKEKMENAGSMDMLQQIRVLYSDEIETLPHHWGEIINHTYEDRAVALRQ